MMSFLKESINKLRGEVPTNDPEANRRAACKNGGYDSDYDLDFPCSGPDSGWDIPTDMDALKRPHRNYSKVAHATEDSTGPYFWFTTYHSHTEAIEVRVPHEVTQLGVTVRRSGRFNTLILKASYGYEYLYFKRWIEGTGLWYHMSPLYEGTYEDSEFLMESYDLESDGRIFCYKIPKCSPSKANKELHQLLDICPQWVPEITHIKSLRDPAQYIVRFKDGAYGNPRIRTPLIPNRFIKISQYEYNELEYRSGTYSIHSSWNNILYHKLPAHNANPLPIDEFDLSTHVEEKLSSCLNVELPEVLEPLMSKFSGIMAFGSIKFTLPEKEDQLACMRAYMTQIDEGFSLVGTFKPQQEDTDITEWMADLTLFKDEAKASE